MLKKHSSILKYRKLNTSKKVYFPQHMMILSPIKSKEIFRHNVANYLDMKGWILLTSE